MVRANELLYSLTAGRLDPNVPPQLQVIFRPSVQPYLISLFRQAPAQAFAALKMPALIIQGSHDIQVSVDDARQLRSEEHTSELQSLMRISYAVFCLKKKKT